MSKEPFEERIKRVKEGQLRYEEVNLHKQIIMQENANAALEEVRNLRTNATQINTEISTAHDLQMYLHYMDRIQNETKSKTAELKTAVANVYRQKEKVLASYIDAKRWDHLAVRERIGRVLVEETAIQKTLDDSVVQRFGREGLNE